MSEDIIAKLKSERLRQGLSIDALASRSGISHSTIVRIEQKQISPTYKKLDALAGALNCSIHLKRN